MWLYWCRNAGYKYQGLIVGTLLTLTFMARILIETVKFVQEPWEHNLVASIGLNQGQLLSIPFVIIGLAMVIYALRHRLLEQRLTDSLPRRSNAKCKPLLIDNRNNPIHTKHIYHYEIPS